MVFLLVALEIASPQHGHLPKKDAGRSRPHFSGGAAGLGSWLEPGAPESDSPWGGHRKGVWLDLKDAHVVFATKKVALLFWPEKSVP